MARSRDDRSREETLCAVDRQSERTSRAFSLLFQSWMQMGTQIVVGSARIVSDTLEDLNDLYCNPRGSLDDSRGSQGRRRSNRDD
jgi:hypothetical protein